MHRLTQGHNGTETQTQRHRGSGPHAQQRVSRATLTFSSVPQCVRAWPTAAAVQARSGPCGRSQGLHAGARTQALRPSGTACTARIGIHSGSRDCVTDSGPRLAWPPAVITQAHPWNRGPSTSSRARPRHASSPACRLAICISCIVGIVCICGTVAYAPKRAPCVDAAMQRCSLCLSAAATVPWPQRDSPTPTVQVPPTGHAVIP